MSAEQQTEELANYIMKYFPNYIKDSGVAAAAIEVMENTAELQRFMKGRPHDKNKHIVDAVKEYIEQVEKASMERYAILHKGEKVIPQKDVEKLSSEKPI